MESLLTQFQGLSSSESKRDLIKHFNTLCKGNQQIIDYHCSWFASVYYREKIILQPLIVQDDDQLLFNLIKDLLGNRVQIREIVQETKKKRVLHPLIIQEDPEKLFDGSEKTKNTIIVTDNKNFSPSIIFSESYRVLRRDHSSGDEDYRRDDIKELLQYFNSRAFILNEKDEPPQRNFSKIKISFKTKEEMIFPENEIFTLSDKMKNRFIGIGRYGPFLVTIHGNRCYEALISVRSSDTYLEDGIFEMKRFMV
jgi:hypothetical protein